MTLGVMFCIIGFIVTSIWKFRYLKKLDLPIRLQWEPWKVNAMFWGIIVVLWGLAALSFVAFGSPIKHARAFGNDPVGDALMCMALAVFLPNFIMWGIRKPSKAITLIVCGFIFLLLSQLSSSGMGSELKNLLIVCAVLFIGAGMVGGKFLFLVMKFFMPKLKSRRKFRALQKPKYSRDPRTHQLVRAKKERNRRRRNRDEDEYDEEDEDDD